MRAERDRPSRRRQRLLIAATLTAVLGSAALTLPRAEPARAAGGCGPGDANRAALTTGQGRTVRPCLSKVNLRIEVPRTKTSSRGCGLLFLQPCYEGKWKVTGVQRSGLQTVTFADGSTERLYRLTFRDFTLDKDVSIATTQHPTGPPPGYTLRLLPDASAQLGGTGSDGDTVYTDLWVTADSSMSLELNVLGVGINCDGALTVDNALLAVSSLIPVTAPGCGMDLNVRYIVTTAGVGDLDNKYAVKLPNTRMLMDP